MRKERGRVQEGGKTMDMHSPIETAVDTGCVCGLTQLLAVHDQDGHRDKEVKGEICVHGVVLNSHLTICIWN